MSQNMDKHQQVVQLCLPLLRPKDICVLQCTCRELNAMRVSWDGHRWLGFKLNGSPSAISWLHKYIVTMKDLHLLLTFNPPKQLLQDLFKDGR
jgi:hypothetical protein